MKAKSANLISPRDMDLIRKYLLGGAAIGGGAGLVTSLSNHLKTVQREGDDSSKDDDTIYLNLPGQQPIKQAVIGGGLALAGGALATLGSYAAVRKAYQAMKRKRMQAELDEAQNAYLGSVETEGKSASMDASGKPMGMVELLTSAPIAVPILLGLGSGALAHKFLDSSFPARRKRQTLGPRRVVLRTQPPATPDEELPEEMKSASDHTSGAELLVQLVLGNPKQASLSELTDMVAAAATGRCNEMELAFANSAVIGLELVKGASETPSSLPLYMLGAGYVTKSAMLSPTVRQLAAAEFADMAPTFFKLAGELDEDTAEALMSIMDQVQDAVRHDTVIDAVRVPDMSKHASAVPGEEELILRRFLDGADHVPESTMDSSSSEDNKDDQDKDQITKARKPQLTAIGPAAEKMKSENIDLIDQVLEGAEPDVPQPV